MAQGLHENVEFFELTYLDPEVVELDTVCFSTLTDGGRSCGRFDRRYRRSCKASKA